MHTLFIHLSVGVRLACFPVLAVANHAAHGMQTCLCDSDLMSFKYVLGSGSGSAESCGSSIFNFLEPPYCLA